MALTFAATANLVACGGSQSAEKKEAPTETKKAAPPTADDAAAFVTSTDADLKRLWTKAAKAEWVKSTYITPDTQYLAAKENEAVMGYTSKAIQNAATFNGLALNPAVERQLKLLKISSSLPAPSDAEKRARLAAIASDMEGIYGAGKICESSPALTELHRLINEAHKKEKKESKGKKKLAAPELPKCLDLLGASRVLAESKNYDAQLNAWELWRKAARGEERKAADGTDMPTMKSQYLEFMGLGNQGAQEIGFADMRDLWTSGYDMPPEEFEATVEKLWQEVKPLYNDLHCYVRNKMADGVYKGKVDPTQKIPAHLLGNMWAQEWTNLYDDVQPYQTKATLDVTKALRAQKYDDQKMVKLAESFFTSLGMKELPDSFWKNSMFVKPRDRDVVCHASAWDLTSEGKDVRIKMCIKVDEEDLITIHHELGHIYYYLYYGELPVLFQQGAHDGFHEAIGDALALSINPSYLKKVGILKSVPNDEKGLINVQMKTALEKIAFLPFGRMIDQWRWDVFSGKVAPEQMNEHWWKLRGEYQGIAAPSERPADAFDPGAKYHIPANVPYVRYFLSFILQFQFHKAMCEAAGHTGPLHTCSIHGSEEAGQKLQQMLEMGASKPWPDAMEAITGQRDMSASAILEYFAPLRGWLKTQNKGKTCGW